MSFGSRIPANTNQVKNLMSTSVLNGCEVSTSNVIPFVSGDITVSPGVIRFVDNSTNPELPNFKGDKVFAGETLVGVSLSDLRAIRIDCDLNVTAVVFPGTITPAERRDIVELATVSLAGFVLRFYSQIGFDVAAQVKDATDALGIIRLNGLRLQANGVNLSVNRTAGEEFNPFYQNYPDDKKNTSFQALDLVSPFTFFDTWQDVGGPGGTGFNFNAMNTSLRPAVYDDGQADVTGPDGTVNNNQAQIFRVYEASGSFGVLFGQQVYNSMSDAVDALPTETFTLNPVFLNNAAFRGFIVVRGGAIDLTDPLDALFFDPASKFVEVTE